MDAMLSNLVSALAALKDEAKDTSKLVETENGHALLVHRDGRILFDATHEADPKPLKTGSPIGLTTLTGIAAFVKEAIARHAGGNDVTGAAEGVSVGAVGPMFLHVVSPTKVVLASAMTFGPLHQRETFAVAEVKRPQFPFGQYQSVEDFIVQSLTLFEDTNERQSMLEFVSRITSGPITTNEDDGFGQKVNIAMGVSGAVKTDGAFRNPAHLSPFRTFREVDQPASDFVLRFNGGGPNQKPMLALFGADGGQWELEALESVRLWLDEQKLGIPVVA